MKIQDRLKQQEKKQLEKVKKNREHLSKRDIEDLMGIHQDRYTRKNGAIRRK